MACLYLAKISFSFFLFSTFLCIVFRLAWSCKSYIALMWWLLGSKYTQTPRLDLGVGFRDVVSERPGYIIFFLFSFKTGRKLIQCVGIVVSVYLKCCVFVSFCSVFLFLLCWAFWQDIERSPFMTRLRAHLGGKRCVFFLVAKGAESEREWKNMRNFFFVREMKVLLACSTYLPTLPTWWPFCKTWRL